MLELYCNNCGREINTGDGCFRHSGLCNFCWSQRFNSAKTASEIQSVANDLTLPLRAEIASLKAEINDWKQRFNASESRYNSLIASSVGCVQAKDEKYAALKAENERLRVLAEKQTPCEINDYIDENYERHMECPICGCDQIGEIKGKYLHYCPGCGQKLGGGNR